MLFTVPTGGGAIWSGIGGLISTGISFIPVIGGIVSSLLSIFGGGGNEVAKLQEQMNQQFTRVGQAIDAMKRFSWAIGRAGLGALLLVSRIITDMAAELVKAFRSLLDALKKLYEDVIKPALRALRAIRKILDDVYKRWLRPILNAIQKVRRVLAIFRAFGFKWAGALDARLARIEGRIIGPYLWILRQLNGYGSWINVILTAGGVLQKPLFLNSVYANIGQITNLWWVAQSGGLSGAPSLTVSPAGAPVTLFEVQSQMQQYAQTNSGPLADAAARALLAAQQTNFAV